MIRFKKFFQKALNQTLQWLESRPDHYQQRIYNNPDNLYRHIRKGDVVLVEGSSRLSRIIKLFSNSHWSHIAMYVGDELIRRNRPGREKYMEAFGEDARHYQDYNIRVCRPFGIRRRDLRIVLQTVINNLGKKYDQRNIIDIALMLLPPWLNPFKKRSITACLGHCNEYEVICSGMIARAFQLVGYPIIPILNPSESERKQLRKNPYGAKLLMRHYSQIMPRDFDLSPNFEIIKFNIIKNGRFDYRSLPWEEEYLIR
jgi:hypothetical protein